MSKALILVGGGKGGVGKSLFSMAVVDFLESTKEAPFLIETDTSVPDVFKTYRETIEGELVNLDEREGWIELVNLIESRPESTIVINTGARNQTGITNFGRTLRKALPELKRKLGVFWLIDRKRESLELLSDFLRGAPGSRDPRRAEHVSGRREQVRALQRVEHEGGDRRSGRQVPQFPRAGGQGDGRDERGTAHDCEGMQGALFRRPHRGRAVARRVQGDVGRGNS